MLHMTKNSTAKWLNILSRLIKGELMMNFKKTLCVLLSVTSFIVASCNKTNDNFVDEEKEKTEFYENRFVVEENLSTYYLVTSNNPLKKEQVAAQEFTYFMKEATDADFQTIKSKDVKNSYKYISLGETDQFKAAFPDFDDTNFKNSLSNYFIATKDYNIYIYSGQKYSGYGVLYGVYDLLKDLINYTYYHDTEIYYDHVNTVRLPNYKNKTVIPSFDARSISTLYTMSHDVHGQRLRLINNSRGVEWNRALYGHNHIQYILGPWDYDEENQTNYGTSHPDWFIFPGQERPSGNIRNTQILNGFCYTAVETGLHHVVAQKLIKDIMAEPESIYVMCAQEDIQFGCNCERCQRAMKEWGGTTAGLQIDFMNHVIEEVEEYLAVNAPGREIQYLTFSYLSTIDPPIKVDENGRPIKDKDGNYIPYSDRILPHEKLRIYLAPITANYAFTFSSPINAETKIVLDGWSAVAKNKIIMYLYDLNYRIYFVNFNNFGTVAGMYQECKDAGATYMLTQGVSDSNTTCFDEMRSYVEANLMWDLSLSYEELADDFLKHFYRDAYPYMKDIYETVRNRYAYYQTLVQPSTGDTTGDIRNPNLYPLSLVRQLDLDIKYALESIEYLQQENYSLYGVLKNRIMKEYLSVIYLKIILYSSNYTSDEINEMLKIWDLYTQLFGITHSGEGVDIDSVFGV